MAIYNETGATTLPYTAQGPFGKFQGWRQSYNYNGNFQDVDGTFKVRLYATSDSTKTWTSTWVKLAEETFTATYFTPRPGEPTGIFSINFNNSRFVGANSFAVQVSTTTGNYVHTNVGLGYLYYATAAISVLDTGNSMGQFLYFATDGGEIG